MELTVYLAGGMKGDWQDRVMNVLPNIQFVDPRSSGLSTEEAYTLWDLLGIEECDIVFVYLAKDNPSGFGLCVEAGYGKALGKHVISVLEDHPKIRYFGMVRAVSDVVVNTLDEGIALLSALAKGSGRNNPPPIS